MTDRKKTRGLAVATHSTASPCACVPAPALPQALYRQIVDVSPTGILVVAADGQVRFANAAMAALIGLAPTAMLGRALADLLLDADAADLLRLPPTGKHERDVKFRRAHATSVWTLCSVSALVEGDGNAGTLIAVTDISARKQGEEALRASEQRLRTLVENEPECVKLMDADGHLLHINRAGLHMIEAEKIEHVLGRSVYALIAPADREGYRNLHRSAAEGSTGCIKFEILTLKGARRWLETTVAPVPSETGERLVLGITRDVTDRHQAEAARRKSDELLRLVVQALPLGVWVFDAKQRVLMANPAGVALLADAGAGDNDVQQICHYAVAAALTTGAVVHNDIVEYDAPAGRKTILHSAVPIRDATGTVLGAVAVKQDVSDYRRAQERIDFLASHDPLTGLANRRLFTQRLQAALAAGGDGGAVLLLDLDRFKTVNESLGHDAGDEVLRAMGQRLAHGLRTDDTLAYLSGDEFGVVLPRLTSLKEIEALAETLLRAIAEPVYSGAREFVVTGCMGIALYPRDGSEANEVLRHADAALYRAKAQGRNTYRLYAHGPKKAILDRLDLERELRRAIEREEFVLHYQPQLDVHSNRIVGAEALVRWNHGTMGVVSPAQFIPLAEETGLIVPLSEWILGDACRQGGAWRAEGLGPLRIAVNMSGFSFKSGGPKQPSIARVVEDILAHSGLTADGLEIELTESMLMHDVAETLQRLADLSALGVHLAIDDFGIGYSSLNYLKRFPIDVLKIDQSFVGDLARDPNDAAIVSAIIGLAHTLDLCVVAEGVETATQLQFLRDRRCDLYQGYFAARPLAADVFAAHLREHNVGQ